MRRAAVLSPRGTPVELPDLASRGRLIAGQRVNSLRLRRRVARRARFIAGGLAVLILIGATLEGAALGAAWLVRSPRFTVTSIEVTGQSRLTRDDIVAAAGISPRANLFALDPREIVARLEELPLIRRAEVIRTFPDRVTLIVEERRPFTVVHADRLHWIDEEGVSLGVESRAVALSTPVLSGLGAEDLGVNGHGGASERTGIGISLLHLLLRSKSSLLNQISEIDVSRSEGPVLYTVDGVEVRLGKDDWEARIGRLQGVLAQLGASGEGVTSVDLRFRDQVVLKTAAK
jgi:cell division protein FtsQ